MIAAFNSPSSIACAVGATPSPSNASVVIRRRVEDCSFMGLDG